MRALGGGGRAASKVGLAVHVVASVGHNAGRRAEWATLGGAVGEENRVRVGAEDRRRTSQNGRANTNSGQLAQGPGDLGLGTLNLPSKSKGSDAVESKDDVAEDCLRAEVGSSQLCDWHGNRVLRSFG